MMLKPCELADARAFIVAHHRHHKPPQGHRFSLSAVKDGQVVGVAVIGRPVARKTCQRTIVEVTRLATDGTRNACSFLYGAAARAAKSLGYALIQTFILESECGASLRAAGWIRGHTTEGGTWNRPSRDGRRDDQPQEPKVRYYLPLTTPKENPE